MRDLGIALTLLLTATLLTLAALPLGLLHLSYNLIRYNRKKERLSKIAYLVAYLIDVLACGLFRDMFNIWFIKRGGYHFGQGKEAITSALGKNWILRRLTDLGEGCVGLLNWIDHDHCWKYIEGERPVGEKPEPVKAWKIILFTAFALSMLAVTVWFLTLIF